MQQFRCLFEEGNQVVKCLTCTSAGARHAEVFGHQDLSAGDRGQGWGLPANQQQDDASSGGCNKIPLP